MTENLDLTYNKKLLVAAALNKHKLKKDAAKALGVTTKTLHNLMVSWGWA